MNISQALCLMLAIISLPLFSAADSPRATALAELARILDEPAEETVTDSPEIKALLAQLGDDLNEIHRGITLLARAAINGHTQVVKFLCERNIDVNKRIRSNSTALHAAAGFGSIDIIGELLKAGADLTLKDSAGRTPLMKAIINEHNDAARMLIEAGAPRRTRDTSGNTPTSLAEEHNMPKIVTLLKKKQS